jgi:hypothetical protein
MTEKFQIPKDRVASLAEVLGLPKTYFAAEANLEITLGQQGEDPIIIREVSLHDDEIPKTHWLHPDYIHVIYSSLKEI